MTGREQRVVIRGGMSSWVRLNAGVPQGSILGPLLFLVYVNDLVGGITSMVKLFADDTILGASSGTARGCVQELQPDIEKITEWAHRWKVTLSIIKTKCLTVTRRKAEFAPLSLDGRLVEEVEYHCHLGLRLQNDGRWKRQVDHMISRAEKRISILKAYSTRFQRRPLLRIYLAYIRPLLEYGAYIWCNITKGEETQLEAVQLAALRILTDCKIGTNHHCLLREFDLPTLKRRRYVSRMTKFYEVLHRTDVGRMNSSSFVRVASRNPYQTRRGEDLSLLLARTEQCRMSFRFQCIRDWNVLPDMVKTADNKHQFKGLLQKKPQPPDYYGIEWNRTSSINLARLQCGNANLNYNLFLRNMCDTLRANVEKEMRLSQTE